MPEGLPVECRRSRSIQITYDRVIACFSERVISIMAVHLAKGGTPQCGALGSVSDSKGNASREIYPGRPPLIVTR